MDKRLEELYRKNLLETKRKLKACVSRDWLIIQAVNAVGEINKVSNMLSRRLREWYELHNPEFSKLVFDHSKFVEIILKKSREELLKEIGLAEDETMGAKLPKEDIEPMLELAKSIKSLYELRALEEKYIEKLMKEICPNLYAVAGNMIGAKLLALAGSLEKMSWLPSSTIQLLGAEKALFRHLKTGAKPPKYGIIHEHPVILHSALEMHGKMARMLADKMSIAVKVDFFKGKFIGDKLLEEIKRRAGK
jgi:nucleolar protein 56